MQQAASFPCETAQLVRIRAFLRNACTAWELAETLCDELELAVDEAASDVMAHGRPNGPLHLEMRHENGAIAVLVTADPIVSPRPLAARASRGLGLFLMRVMMDEVDQPVVPEGRVAIRMIRYPDHRSVLN